MGLLYFLKPLLIFPIGETGCLRITLRICLRYNEERWQSIAETSLPCDQDLAAEVQQGRLQNQQAD